ncbi:mechanosensitive ion channel protein [Anaerobacillus alkalidiazotrophicus]|uniref:Mechanosensitive ion channel protein n=1 Tax=Anaerobacillus alkalidiazotrophicus TaxID=472963 RepID=A0A1S2M501_9BACI|nr:mechanosensitive ion channel family protein [Anaerobacillus alkalidiazotrophicus]OIJ18715.1 mechanosensitive ion channel protein [Anaerobacillus alkalidiazotrophicus]
MDFEWIMQYDWSAFILNLIIILVQLLAIFLVYLLAKKIGSGLIIKSFSKLQEQKGMHPGRTKTLEKLTINVFTYFLIFILITIVIGIFDYEIAPLIAGAGIIGLAIGFGAQGLVSDVVTGFFILLEKQIEVDEYVSMAGLDGVVEEVGLRTTKLRGFDGTLHFIPNRQISNVSNHSRGTMRALVDISISYDENIDKAMDVLQQACDEIAKIDETIKEGPNVVGVQSLGDSDVVIRIIAKTENMAQWAVERRLRKALKETLDQHGIEIPFPHQVYIEKK